MDSGLLDLGENPRKAGEKGSSLSLLNSVKGRPKCTPYGLYNPKLLLLFVTL